MSEMNPHRQIARIFAFLCYFFAGLLVVAGIVFTVAVALTDLSVLPLKVGTNRQMAFISASIFLVIAGMITLFGLRVQKLFGQQRRQEKLAAKSAVGCLRLGSLGCGLWSLISVSMTAIIGKLLPTGEPAGAREAFVGSSGAILIILVMLSVAWFISVNYVRLRPDEVSRVYDAYRNDMKSLLVKMAEPETRAYAQQRTMEVLGLLDAPLKSRLLEFLSESGLLTGDTPISMRHADFRRIDLRSISLPRADLQEVNLEHATLHGAILFEVNLRKANLRKADLSRANLQKADLRQADLTEAMLENTNLSGADLTGAKVTLMQLEQAHLEKTFLPDGKMSD